MCCIPCMLRIPTFCERWRLWSCTPHDSRNGQQNYPPSSK
uniref:Uncharacterized protein n=1 Tax=Arundo donax TaxID=35708 RepID=A0A0A9HIL4_ARUDO